MDIVSRAGKAFTLFATDNFAGFRVFDVKRVGDEYIIACAFSSGPNKEPPNIWTGKVSGSKRVRIVTSSLAQSINPLHVTCSSLLLQSSLRTHRG